MASQWTYNNHLSELDHLAKDLERFGAEQKVDKATLYALNVCLDEIVTNIIQHAYPGGVVQGTIDVQIERIGDAINVCVVDAGIPFNPLVQICSPEMLKKPIEERPVGGLGIYLMRRLMDDIQYKRENGKNILLLRKLLKKTV